MAGEVAHHGWKLPRLSVAWLSSSKPLRFFMRALASSSIYWGNYYWLLLHHLQPCSAITEREGRARWHWRWRRQRGPHPLRLGNKQCMSCICVCSCFIGVTWWVPFFLVFAYRGLHVWSLYLSLTNEQATHSHAHIYVWRYYGEERIALTFFAPCQ
jgi:hypothetical protein